MRKATTLFLIIATFCSSFAQTKRYSITDTTKINLEKIATQFDIQNYFEDKDLSKKGEYKLLRKRKLVVQKEETKDNINYNLVFHSSDDTFANFGSLDFNNIEGFTNKENTFYGLVFKNYTKLNDESFKEKIDYLQEKLGKPNYQFRDPMWDLVGKKLFSWKIKNLIYVAYLDYQDWLRLHIINFDKLKEIEKTELGWKLVDL